MVWAAPPAISIVHLFNLIKLTPHSPCMHTLLYLSLSYYTIGASAIGVIACLNLIYEVVVFCCIIYMAITPAYDSVDGKLL